MKAERDFKLVCTGGPYGDCCCSYAVELRGEWTVQELVKAVLERNPCEWGFFYIQRAGQKLCRRKSPARKSSVYTATAGGR